MGNGISALIAGVSYNSTRKIIVHPILVDAISTLYCLKTCLALKACLADSVRVIRTLHYQTEKLVNIYSLMYKTIINGILIIFAFCSGLHHLE